MENKAHLTKVEKIDLLADLSKKLSAISNPNRIKVFVIIARESNKSKETQKPLDVRGINEILKKEHKIEISGPGLEVHLNKLLDAGLIKKETTSVERGRGKRAVWEYLLVPGELEALSRQVNQLNNNIISIQSDISGSTNNLPLVKVLGGDDDGKVYEINREMVRIGRKGDIEDNDPEYIDDIVLDNYYINVSRVYKPHASIIKKEDFWYIKDNDSRGGVFLNNKKIRDEEKLNNNDIIKFSVGEKSAQLLFINELDN